MLNRRGLKCLQMWIKDKYTSIPSKEWDKVLNESENSKLNLNTKAVKKFDKIQTLVNC